MLNDTGRARATVYIITEKNKGVARVERGQSRLDSLQCPQVSVDVTGGKSSTCHGLIVLLVAGKRKLGLNCRRWPYIEINAQTRLNCWAVSETDSTTTPRQRYKLLKKLATGGMGSVWLATDEQLGRSVAYKVIETAEGDEAAAMRRFRLEASALAQLRSTHIVEVYDFGIECGQPFMVMELLTGMSLQKRLRADGPLPFDVAFDIVFQVGLGLKAAHARGLVHRDLKPSNIFITKRDGRSVVKLIDFGVAKETSKRGAGEDTATGMLLGTPQYMSPEQVRGSKDVDQRSDLWALAVVLYRMLTGISPFSGASVGDIALRICSDSLPNIQKDLPKAPGSLAEFFAKAFQRSPAARFQRVEDFVLALGPALGFDPISFTSQANRPSNTGSDLLPPSDTELTRISTPAKGAQPASDSSGSARASEDGSWLSRGMEATPPSSTVVGIPLGSRKGRQRLPKSRYQLMAVAALALGLFAALIVLTRTGDVPVPLEEKAAARAQASSPMSARRAAEPASAREAPSSSASAPLGSASSAPAASRPKSKSPGRRNVSAQSAKGLGPQRLPSRPPKKPTKPKVNWF